jgi:hypothetical protein
MSGHFILRCKTTTLRRNRAMSATKATHTMRRGRRHDAGSPAARWFEALRRLFAELSSSYHPERHYMRGGGTGGVA